jgi:hypothetical protein
MRIGRSRICAASWIAANGVSPSRRSAGQGKVDHQDRVLHHDADQQETARAGRPG